LSLVIFAGLCSCNRVLSDIETKEVEARRSAERPDYRWPGLGPKTGSDHSGYRGPNGCSERSSEYRQSNATALDP
jgi:hypothetical protein